MKQMPKEDFFIKEMSNKGNLLACRFGGTHKITKNCMFGTKQERDLADQIAEYCEDKNDWMWKFIATARILNIESVWAA